MSSIKIIDIIVTILLSIVAIAIIIVSFAVVGCFTGIMVALFIVIAAYRLRIYIYD